MNILSWLLYVIGVLGGLNGAFIAMAIIGSIAAVFLTIWFIAVGCNQEDKSATESLVFWRKLRNVFIPIFILGWLGTILIPDRRTMILIASSEVGERVLNSQGVKEISGQSYDLLKKWIAKETGQIDEEIMNQAVERVKEKVKVK